MSLRVFPDTGVLVAMLVFPEDRAGVPTLAGEVLSLSEAGEIEWVIGRVVIDELEEVIDRDFPDWRAVLVAMVMTLPDPMTRRPTPGEVAVALPFTTDPDDAPIFAGAVIAQPEIVLSNDFRAFHTPLAKGFWNANGIVVESLYGLLCHFGRRERKGERDEGST